MRAAACIGVIAALALAGCGSKQGHTIPAGDAQSLIAGLDRVTSQFDSGACNGAEAKVRDLEDAAGRLRSSVDPEVKNNIEAGLRRLEAIVHRDCQRPQTTTTSSTTSSSTPTTTSTTTTTSSSTSTTSSSTSSSSESPGGVVPPSGGTGTSGGATSP
jgi:outer membrane murein-binding lipoprotein Lpp